MHSTGALQQDKDSCLFPKTNFCPFGDNIAPIENARPNTFGEPDGIGMTWRGSCGGASSCSQSGRMGETH